ncbi:MAG TPA: hypothetical protein VML55_25825, partial [Planctomycetaceae bacterium]|nr:hypothetical protein [Planctomycetaceae bacterium]
RFASRFGIAKPENPTSNVELETIRQFAPEFARGLEGAGTAARRDDADGPRLFNLGVVDTLQVLAEAGDPVGQRMKQLFDAPDPDRPKVKGPLGQQLDSRNNSLLGHGTTPVAEEPARSLRETVAVILNEHLKSEGHTLETILATAQFVRCPWLA